MTKAARQHKSAKEPAPAAPVSQGAGSAKGFLTNRYLHLLIVALVAFAAYSNTFSVPFNLDDQSSIIDLRVIRDLSTFLSGPGYAHNPRRFIGYLSFALNYKFGGLDTTGYHVVNLAIHIITGWLVYALARLTLGTTFFRTGAPETGRPARVSGRLDLALVPFIAALLFVAHPVQTQAITYIVQRFASLATMFYLLSVVLYVWARLVQEKTQKAVTFGVSALFVLSMAAAVLAMRTKEIAATLPLLIVAYEFTFFKTDGKKKLLFLIPFIVLLLIIPLNFINSAKPAGELLADISQQLKVETTMGRGTYLLTQFSVIATYIRLLFLPIAQNLDYDYPIYNSLFEPPVFGGFVLICCLVGLALHLFNRSRRNSEPEFRLIAFGIAWFFLTLSVESSFIPIADVIFEHRLYLPSIGAVIAISAGVLLLQRQVPIRFLAALMFCITFILTGATWARNAVWASTISIWTDTVNKSPGKARPHFNLCKMLLAEDRLDEAFEETRIALEIDPENPEAQNNMGVTYQKKGMMDQALVHYREAVRLAPHFLIALVNYGATCEAKGLNAEAIKQYQEVLRRDPWNFDAHNNLGGVYIKLEKFDAAIADLKKALEIDPDRFEAVSNLGICYEKTERLDEAVALYEKALQLKPGNVSALLNMGNVVSRKGDTSRAMEYYREAIRVEPKQSLGYVNLGIVYYKVGQLDKALEQFEAAQQAVPGDPLSKELIAKIRPYAKVALRAR